MRLRHAATLAALSAASGSVIAQPEATEVALLDTVIVTASRVPEKLDETLAPVTVISREDIERLQPRDLQELLVGLPGVNLTSNGGSGKATQLLLRGGNADHVVVLLDGVRIGSVTLGTTAFEQIPVDQIERVEIVRGPRSSLYGSEAIGGVMQIFTRRSQPGEASTGSFAIGGGSQGSGKFETTVRGSAGSGGWYNLGISGQSTEGVNVQPAAGEPDRDGYHSIASSASAGWRFASDAELGLSGLLARSHNEYDSSYTNESENGQQALGAYARFLPLSFWTVNLRAGQSQDLSDNVHDPLVPSFSDPAVYTDNRGIINTRRNLYSWQNDFQLLPGQLFTAGLDYEHDTVSGNTDYAVRKRDDAGVFGQYQGHFGAHELQGSLRRDKNQQFGTHNTGSAQYGYRFSPALRAGLSYGTAFKAPSFNDLYYPYYGLPGLKPETSHSYEFNLGGSGTLAIAQWDWALSAYRSKIDELITYNPSIFGPENLGRARIRGVELQLGGQWQALRTQLYYNWLDPKNDNDDANHGKQLARRSKQNARLDLDYQGSRYAAGSTLNLSDARYEDPANSTRLGGYTTLDLRASLQLDSAWQLQLKAANVLDKQYQTAAGFALPGATYFATLRYTPAAR